MRKPAEFAGFPTKTLGGLAPYGPYRAIVRHVVDGDTLDVLIDSGFNNYTHQTIRVRGINAPELREATGKVAHAYVRELLPPGTPCVVKTYKDAITFGRYVADVYIDVEGVTYSLGQHLVQAGHAALSER
jgi:micrococcal nuclease